MSEQDSMSERELADFFADEVFSGKPRSVGEALAAADGSAPAEEDADLQEEVDEEAATPPVVVTDEPSQPPPPPEPTPEEPEAEVGEVEDEEEADEIGEDENVVWATKKYGDDPAKWAQAARHQEQHISRLAAEKKEAENLAGEWYQYAQGVEQQAQQMQQQAMPLSASEENWIEQSVMMNPHQAAMQAAMSGNLNLYNAVIGRVAEENALLAGQIGAQVQREMEQLAAQENGQYQQQPSLQDSMASSIQRLGIDLQTYGEPMSAKIGELGEHHPYVQTILEGEQSARDMALMAVYDLVRASAMSTRKVRSEERENQIKHEAELRRQAAGVVTGGPQAQETPKQSPFMEAMESEWKARGQWSDE